MSRKRVWPKIDLYPKKISHGDFHKYVETRIENGQDVFYSRETGKRLKSVSIKEFLKQRNEK